MNRFLTVVAVALAAYGVGMGFAYPAGGFFAVWFVLAGLLAAAVWVPDVAGMVFRVVCVVLFAWICFGLGLMAADFGDVPPGGVNYIVVLGAGLEDDGTPSEALTMRLDTAAAYLEANPGTRCVVSGGQSADEVRPEADAMAAYLTGQKGIDEKRVIKEAASTSTVENIQNSAKLIPEDSTVAVVTNDFHMHRALAIARKQGLPQAYGLAAPSNPLYLGQAGLREVVVTVKDAITGGL